MVQDIKLKHIDNEKNLAMALSQLDSETENVKDIKELQSKLRITQSQMVNTRNHVMDLQYQLAALKQEMEQIKYKSSAVGDGGDL